MGLFSNFSKKVSSQNSNSENFLEKANSLRVPLLFLMGFGVAALSIEIFFEYVLKSSKTNLPRSELNLKKLQYLQPYNSYQEIISKNIFCPGCPIPDLESRKIERPKDCNKADRIGGGIKLIGTIVLNVAQYSVATLSTGGEAKSYKVGDQISGYGKVFEIRRDRLCILKNDDKLSYVEMEGVPKSIYPSIESGMSYRPTSSASGVTQLSETDFDLKQDVFLKSLTDKDVLNSAYAVPYFINNELSGYRLESIEPGSPLLSLGLRPNDVIVKADNQPLNSPAKIQELVAGASGLNSLVITVLRNGQEVSLNYKVSK
jgi:type II secretion system protein C